MTAKKRKPKQTHRPPPRGREEVRRALIDAGIELFSERGPGGVSVRDVANAAGVNHALIFRHFGNKEGFVRAVFEALVQQMRPQPVTSGTAEERLQRALETTLAKREFWRLLTFAALDGDDQILAAIPSPYTRETIELLRENQRDGIVADDVDPRIAVASRLALGLGWQVFQRTLLAATDLEDEDPEDVMAQVDALWSKTLRPTDK